MARVEVDLPWDLEELTFADVGPGFRKSPTIRESMQFLFDTAGSYEGQDEEYGRIFLAAGLLAAKFPDRPVTECLDQAIVWERG
jgi:hypothetical protein